MLDDGRSRSACATDSGGRVHGRCDIQRCDYCTGKVSVRMLRVSVKLVLLLSIDPLADTVQWNWHPQSKLA